MSGPAEREPERPSGDLPPGTRLVGAIIVLLIVVVMVVAGMHEGSDTQGSCRITVASHGVACASVHGVGAVRHI